MRYEKPRLIDFARGHTNTPNCYTGTTASDNDSCDNGTGFTLDCQSGGTASNWCYGGNGYTYACWSGGHPSCTTGGAAT